MSLNIFSTWLKRNNFSHEPKTIREKYFYNMPMLEINAIKIELSASNIYKVFKDAEKIKKYCARHELSIYSERKPNSYSIFDNYTMQIIVCSAYDQEILDNYYSFVESSVNECENTIHQYSDEAGRIQKNADLNNKLYKIMEKHETNYLKSIAV